MMCAFGALRIRGHAVRRFVKSAGISGFPIKDRALMKEPDYCDAAEFAERVAGKTYTGRALSSSRKR